MSIPAITLHNPQDKMPQWAMLERQTLSVLSQGPQMLKDYLTPEGELFWPESVKNFQTFTGGYVDNVFEGFANFPLLYVLGGDDSLLEYSQKEYDVLTAQFSRIKKIDLTDQQEAERTGRDTMLIDELFAESDWMHTGEGLRFFYFLLMANPAHAKNIERVLRFAQINFGENPSGRERNYDPEHHVFKHCYMGANGPAYEKFGGPLGHEPWMDCYGLVFFDVPGVSTLVDVEDPEKAALYGKVLEERRRYDTVCNLLSTTLALNAYAVSGDAQYRDFVTEYVGAWRERAAGYEFMPDNAGPDGVVGGALGGRFYGSHFGWMYPSGFGYISHAMIVGGQNERFFTGRRDALDWARDLYNTLIDRYGLPAKNGGVLFPHKRTDEDSVIEYGGSLEMPLTEPATLTDMPGYVRYRQVDGWYHYGAPLERDWLHLYAASLSDDDVKRMKEIFPASSFEIPAQISNKYFANDLSYVAYLNGECPDYPEASLQQALDYFYRQNTILADECSGKPLPGNGTYLGFDWEQEQKLAATKELHERYGVNWDSTVVHSYYLGFIHYRSPVSVTALLALTMGAVAPLYFGGPLCAEARWFDMDRRRPGLCEGVAALIEKIDETGYTVTLANTSPLRHTLALQGGAYGEHNIVSIDADAQHLDVGGKWACITLTPGTVKTLHVTLERYANQPSFEEPFGAYDRLG